MLQQVLKILPSSPGAYLGFVVPENYTVSGDLFKNKNTKLPKKKIRYKTEYLFTMMK